MIDRLTEMLKAWKVSQPIYDIIESMLCCFVFVLLVVFLLFFVGRFGVFGLFVFGDCFVFVYLYVIKGLVVHVQLVSHQLKSSPWGLFQCVKVDL